MAAERDDGQDKTDRREDARLVQKELDFQNKMPFYESEPDIKYAPRVKGENE
jgi:hypothetical protein